MQNVLHLIGRQPRLPGNVFLRAGIVVPEQKDGAVFFRELPQKAVQRGGQLLAKQLRLRAFASGDALRQLVQQQLGLPLPPLFGGIFPPAVDGKIPGDLSQEGGKSLGSAGRDQLPGGVIGIVDALLSVQGVG